MHITHELSQTNNPSKKLVVFVKKEKNTYTYDGVPIQLGKNLAAFYAFDVYTIDYAYKNIPVVSDYIAEVTVDSNLIRKRCAGKYYTGEIFVNTIIPSYLSPKSSTPANCCIIL